VKVSRIKIVKKKERNSARVYNLGKTSLSLLKKKNKG